MGQSRKVALYDRLQTELVEARRRRDELVLNTLSLLKSEVIRATKEADAGGSIDDALVERVARKEVKRRQDAIEAYRKGGREDAAKREEAEMALLRGYLTPFDLAAADPAEVEAIIKPTGFFRAKTRRIIAASRKLVEQFGGEVPGNMDDLLKIPGIGRKTANVILGAGFNVPGFAVDTHVIRLTNRLKLVSSRDPVKIERQICSMVPKEEWTGLSLRLILHGRRICIARRPRCEECILNDFCPSSTTRPKPGRRS